MKMKNNLYKIVSIFVLLFFTNCETFDLEQLEDPSSLSQKFLDPVFTFNYVQLELPNFVDTANDFTQRVTRQMAMTGGNTYENAFQPVNSNQNWASGYLILNAVKLMEPKALEGKQFFTLGAAKLIRCYVLMTLVDIYGDIPYTEALQGEKNLFPKYDRSADVYKGILNEIEEAKLLLVKVGGTDGEGFKDLYYDAKSNWVTLANTLKIKMYNNARLAGSDIGVAIGPAINAIVTAGDYIDVPSEDFAFRYGSNRNNPNARHPLYNDQYELGGGAYISNYLMWSMTEEKKDPFQPAIDIIDPRTGFYFCKQDSDPAGEPEFVLPKGVRPPHYDEIRYDSFYVGSIRAPYKVSNWIGPGSQAIVSGGFWGRDHGDNSGIPPDNEKRTCAGVYPIGGKYLGSDVAVSVQRSGVDGGLGAGIMPILLSSYVHFILAEAIIKSSVTGNAKTELMLGINQSIDKTLVKIGTYPKIETNNRPRLDLAEGIFEPGTIASEPITIANPLGLNLVELVNLSSFGRINIEQRKDYNKFIDKIYDGLATDDLKLELIIKEYFIAAWGNGIEPYNNYRRTGFPSNFQPTLEPASGEYYSTAFYPTSVTNNNPNSPRNIRTRKVFWDKANLNLH